MADAAALGTYVYDLEGDFRGVWRAPPDPQARSNVTVMVRTVAAGSTVHILWQYGFGSAAEYILETRSSDGAVLLQTAPKFGPNVSDMAMGPDGWLYVMGGAVIRAVRPVDHVIVDELLPGGSAKDATRLAVLADGRFAYVREDTQRIFVSTGAGTPEFWDFGPLTPRDVAAVTETLRVLVQAPEDGTAPESQPVLLTLDLSGNLLSSRSADDLRVQPPRGTLPGLLAADGGGQVLAIADNRRRLHVYDAAGAAYTVAGADSAVRPEAWQPTHIDLPGEHGGRIAAVDASAADSPLLALNIETGRFTFNQGPAGGGRTALGPDGSLFLAPQGPDDPILRIAPDGTTVDTGVACACPFGGAMAVSGDVLYLARPRSHTVAAVDLATGAQVGSIQLPDARGLWPADIALTAAGTLVTADSVAPEIQSWASAGEPRTLWTAGRGAGSPSRVALGHLQDGTEVVAAVMSTGAVHVATADDGLPVVAGFATLPDGSEPAWSDAAMYGGHLFLADPAGHAIHAFDLPDSVPPPRPTPAPTPSERRCDVTGNKVAGPPRIRLGQSAAVTLTLQAQCTPSSDPVGADIVLVLDHDYLTYRCGIDPFHGASQDLQRMAAQRLIAGVDVRYHRIGLVAVVDGPVDSVATSTVQLTDDPARVLDALDAVGTVPFSQVEAGVRIVEILNQADGLLESGGRPDALPVIIFLTAGAGCYGARNEDDAPPGVPEVGEALRAKGVQLLSVLVRPPPRIGFAPPTEWLRELAGSSDRYFEIDDPVRIDTVVRRIQGLIQEIAATSLAGSLSVIDELFTDVDLIDDTVAPAALQGGRTLTWRRSLLPTTGLTMTYRVRPTTTGLVPTNLIAWAEYTDVDGARRRLDYPVPVIEVVGPKLYLPVAMRNQCLATERVDAVLAIDASSSMEAPGLDGAPKIESALAAARAFTSLLRDGRDRVGLVAFNSGVQVVHPLSTDLASVRRAAVNIGTAPGTRLHAGVQEADAMLGRSGDAVSAIVVLTDGRSDPDPPSLAVEAARAASSRGIHVFAVAFGVDADVATLAAMVSDADNLRQAATGADLEAIYADLARALPCRR